MQIPLKLNVLADIVRDRIPEPFFIVQEEIVPVIQELVDDDFDEVWYQQDGEPAQFRTIVRDYLNEIFNNR